MYLQSLHSLSSATVYSTNFIQIAKCSVLHTDQLYISLLWWQLYELYKGLKPECMLTAFKPILPILYIMITDFLYDSTMSSIYKLCQENHPVI